MQSGISASEELHSAFKSFLSSPDTRALLISIQSESLVPHSTHSATSSFDADLDSLSAKLSPKEALYIVIRTPDSTLAVATYVPDAAPVRQKMLFASTRLTLTRELGNEHFSDSLFATTAEELSAAGWKRHGAHTQAENPLTEEERSIRDIREAEAQEVGGTGRRGAGYGREGGKKADSGPGVVEALKALGKGDLVTLRVDDKERIVLADESKPVEHGVVVEDLSRLINATEPRFTYYGHDAGKDEPAVVFVYTCPTASKIRDRMIYASMRRSAEVLASQESGVPLAQKIEASDPSDVTAEAILGEFKPKQEEKAAFSKPKRPGRR